MSICFWTVLPAIDCNPVLSQNLFDFQIQISESPTKCWICRNISENCQQINSYSVCSSLRSDFATPPHHNHQVLSFFHIHNLPLTYYNVWIASLYKFVESMRIYNNYQIELYSWKWGPIFLFTRRNGSG